MNKKIKYILRIICFFCAFAINTIASNSFGQSNITIYEIQDETILSKKSKKNKSENYIHTLSKNLVKKNHNQGYITASIDSIIHENSNLKLYLNRGEKYFLKKVRTTNNTNQILKSYSTTYNKPKKYSLKKIKQKKRIIVSDFKNQGFPFVQISNQTIIDSSFNISHNFTISPFEYYSFELLQNETLKHSEIKYLSHITRIKKDKPYQKKRIDNIEDVINNTGIYTVDSIQISMNKNKVQIIPSVTPIKQNRLSGWVGIQTDKEEKTTFTGNIEFYTKNIFKYGENINFEWKKQNSHSQLINLSTRIPFVAGLPVGILGELYIDKRDSTFSNQYYKIGLTFLVANQTSLSGYYSRKNSTTHVSNNENLNANQNLYGVLVNYSKLNNPILPTKGFFLNLDINMGNRNSSSSHESLIANYELDIYAFIPIWLGNFVIRNQTGIITNDSVSINEYFQIGGIKTMRGFNENSIFSKSFNISSIEYRLLLNNNSYINAFYDFGLFNSKLNDYRQAIGLGLALSTKAGMLSLSYALGKLNSSPVEIKSGKIHIGYISTF